MQPKPRRTGEEARLTRTSRSPTTTTRAVTTGGKARPATNGRGDRREDPQTMEQAAEHSHSDPRSQRGGHPTTFDDKIYQQSALPYRGKTRLRDQRNPSTFDPMNGGVLSTRYKHTWLSFEKIHAKSGG